MHCSPLTNAVDMLLLFSSLNSFNKIRFITENVKRKPQFEILSPLEYIFFLSNKHYIQQSLQQCLDCLLNLLEVQEKQQLYQLDE